MKRLLILLGLAGVLAAELVAAETRATTKSTSVAAETTGLLAEAKEPRANMAQVRKDVVAAVDQVLALHGNPPFAELINNNPALAAKLNERLRLVASFQQVQKDLLEAEAQKKRLGEELAQRQKELDFARESAGRLRSLIDVTMKDLARIQEQMSAAATTK